MWHIRLLIVALVFTDVFCKQKPNKKNEYDIKKACSATCNVCTDLITDLLVLPKVCSKHCRCLDRIQQIMNKKNTTPCKTINSEIFCKLGRKIDENNCATDNCNTWLPCAEENPLKNCSHSCPHGYKMDIFGCPTCECRCRSDEIGYKGFVHECAQKCNNRYDLITKTTDNCPMCNCTGGKRIITKQDCKHLLKCPASCGTWGFTYNCLEKSPTCSCDCPMKMLECMNVECAWGIAIVTTDEFGCMTGCTCPEEGKSGTDKKKADLDSKCPISIKCPLECGPYALNRIYDFRGCLSECRCECLPPLCQRPCPNNKVMNDMYGCPTCDCAPDWTHCPINCNTTCGPHDRLSPIDERGCPSTCECNCPRATYKKTESNKSDEPRPPLLCPIRCGVVEIQRNRFGCDSCECKAKQCPSIQCQRYCGPHGYVKDRNDCDTCTCKCPSIERCAPCPNGRYIRDGYGCETCRCQCPSLVDCYIDCPEGRVINENGCEICKCAIERREEQPRRSYHRSGCEENDCDEDCEYYKRFPNGCKKCECCRPLHCPDLNCPTGILKVDRDQCPICKCSRKRLRSDIKKDKTNKCPSLKDCKIKCPKLFLKVDENKCPMCECCEPILEKDCPDLRCNKFQTNKYGCPICECDENGALFEMELLTKIPKEDKCPNLKCSNLCEQVKLSINGCPTCECCVDFLRTCPDLKCDSYKVDKFGCVICECQQMHLEIHKKPIHKCKVTDNEFTEKCQAKCNNLFHKVNENNCPTCECCSPRLSNECPKLRCNIYKTDNQGCPICECVEESVTKSKHNSEPKCTDSLNCKDNCKSGFFKTKDQCSTCICCPDYLSQCPKLKCNIYKTNEENCPICECASFHSNKEVSQHSLVNSRCPPINCPMDCPHVHGLLKLGKNNCHICECCEPYLQKCPRLKCDKFKVHPNSGCPICECIE